MSSVIPNDWICPISLQMMRQPMIAPDGYTYERSAILQWLGTNPVSPMTRSPMTADDLVPNRALAATIEAYLQAHPDAASAAPAAVALTPPKAFTPSAVTVIGKTFRSAADDKLYLHVRAAAPTTGERQPVVLLPIIDNSGSMGESVGSAGGVEDMGFTRMYLVKHAVRTMAAILGPDDLLGLVTFSTAARVVLSPVAMDAAGKARVNAALETIHPDASTNIFDGIKKAAQLLADPAFNSHNIVAMLLTDGFPTINPPRGIVPSLITLPAKPARWTLHTFGFGYSLDSALCAEIAEWGGGLFGFIPDATMVGTVFINALATVLATANLDTTFTFSDGTQTGTVAVGPIPFGQPRDYLFEVQGPVTLNGAPVEAGDPEYTLVHKLYVEAIKAALLLCKSARGGLSAAAIEAQTLLAEFEARFNTLDDPIVKALLKDLRASKEGEGQIGMAPAHFARWGEHYMRAYIRAQELQQCMNFKDPGLQIYGGSLFHTLQETGDQLFCDLPAPTPSGRVYRGSSYGGAAGAAAAPTSMAIFHNASGGCFAPETLIHMADGSNKIITSIRRGDVVWTPSGPSTVRALVICGSKNRAQPMTMLGSLVITPFHPVRGTGGRTWEFPADIAGYVDRLIPTVYNLVLDSGHIVNADGWEALTLGHGFTEPVAAHDYFGTDRVVQDLMKQPGWDEGMPRYVNLTTVRDVVTNNIVGWVDDV